MYRDFFEEALVIDDVDFDGVLSNALRPYPTDTPKMKKNILLREKKEYSNISEVKKKIIDEIYGFAEDCDENFFRSEYKLVIFLRSEVENCLKNPDVYKNIFENNKTEILKKGLGFWGIPIKEFLDRNSDEYWFKKVNKILDEKIKKIEE